jgi:hypothetical protein
MVTDMITGAGTSNHPFPQPPDDANMIEWSPTIHRSESPIRRSPHNSNSNSSRSPSPLSFQCRPSASVFSESSHNSFSIPGLSNNRTRSSTSSPSRCIHKIQETDDEYGSINTNNFSSLNNSYSTSNYNNCNTKIEVDPYKLLGLEGDECTLDGVKKAYCRLALLSHPRRAASQFGANSRISMSTPSTSTNTSTSFSNDSTSIRSHKKENNDASEESIREWHFLAIAASYETLCNAEHKYHYDQLIRRRNELGNNSNERKNKFRTKRGFWINFTKGLDINDSFDKGDKNEEVKCCNGNDEGGHSLLNVCGSPSLRNKHRKVINSNTIRSNKGLHDSQSAISPTHRGEKLLLNCKPLMLSDDEASHRQKSTGTEISAATEDENNDSSVREETNHLFGGPLALMYKARQYQPFSDAFELFEQEFGSDIFRSKSCFDDDEDEDETPAGGLDSVSSNWVSGGTGRILNTAAVTPSLRSSTTRSPGSKPALVYPVLPNIPLETLQKYGILDGSMRQNNSNIEKPKVSNRPRILDGSMRRNDTNIEKPKSPDCPNRPNIMTKITHERKNGILSEVKTTTKIHGSMSIVRTQTTLTDESTGKKKTITSVTRGSIPQVLDEDDVAFDDNRNSFFGLVHCCSYSLPPPPPPPTTPPPSQSRPQYSISCDDDSTIASQANSLSTTKFEDKRELRRRMKKLFLNSQRESRQERS